MKERGFTLLELLIAMAITIFVMAAGYSFFNNTFNFSLVHSRKTEMQRETRTAIDILSREVRNAGFGILDPFGDGNLAAMGALSRSITPANNVDPDPSGVVGQLDRITVWGGYEQVGTLTCAVPPCIDPVAAQGDVTVFMIPLAGTTPDISGKTVTIDGFHTAVVTAVVAGPIAGVYTLTLSAGLDRNYSSAASVVLLQQVAYQVDTTGAEPFLSRSVNGGAGQLIASGIEDLQFAYVMQNGTIVDNPAGAATDIRAVRISMLARQRDPSATAEISTRPAVEDHAAAASADRYHRRLITRVVEVRNHGLRYQ
jgi:prepilin-type N-terminal cleavage/methylation domain-containing protein